MKKLKKIKITIKFLKIEKIIEMLPTNRLTNELINNVNMYLWLKEYINVKWRNIGIYLEEKNYIHWRKKYKKDENVRHLSKKKIEDLF